MNPFNLVSLEVLGSVSGRQTLKKLMKEQLFTEPRTLTCVSVSERSADAVEDRNALSMFNE